MEDRKYLCIYNGELHTYGMKEEDTRYQYIQELGITQVEYVQKADNINPTIAITPNGINMANVIEVTISASDNKGLLGSNTYEYYLSSSKETTTGGSWIEYKNGTTFSIGTGLTGTYYLHVKSVSDVSGNTSGNVVSESYYFDNTAPNEFTPTVIAKTPTSITIGGTTTDNNGPVVTYEYSIDNGENWQYSNTFTGLTAGTRYSQIQVKAKDTLGNERVSSNISVVTGGPSDGSYVSTKRVNSPKLGTGMMAVYWNDEGEEITSTSPETDLNFNYSQWYDYIAQTTATTNSGTSKWANAKTADGSYWVWIPRYAYAITSGYHGNGLTYSNRTIRNTTQTSTTQAGTIDIEFLKGTTNTGVSGKTSWDNVIGENKWNIHPAFYYTDTDSSTKQLTGFWISKYAMSMETNGTNTNVSNATIGNVNISSTIKAVSKPGLITWGFLHPNTAFKNGLLYNSSLESHLIKNMEWGALIYLAHSKYGRNATQIGIFDYNYAGGKQGATIFDNSILGTTGNEYGVFDMMSIVASYSSSANTTLAKDMIAGAGKYKECYSSYPSTTYGDALYEIAKAYSTATANNNSFASWYLGTSVWFENASGNTNSHNFISRGGQDFGSMFAFGHVRDKNSTGTDGITDNDYHIVLWCN